jgi:hypothetical protein
MAWPPFTIIINTVIPRKIKTYILAVIFSKIGTFLKKDIDFFLNS